MVYACCFMHHIQIEAYEKFIKHVFWHFLTATYSCCIVTSRQPNIDKHDATRVNRRVELHRLAHVVLHAKRTRHHNERVLVLSKIDVFSLHFPDFNLGHFFLHSSQQLSDFIFEWVWFLALLCATAQQSNCRHAGVRRPSPARPSVVRPSNLFYQKPWKWNKAKYLGKLPVHHISRLLFCCFSKKSGGFYDFFPLTL